MKAMKKNQLAVLFMMGCSTCSAQTTPRSLFSDPVAAVSEKKATARLLSAAGNNKIYGLPLDNTLCIATDVSQITAIPNAAASGVGYIPNALEEKQLLPNQHTTPYAYHAPKVKRNLLIEAMRQEKNKNTIPGF